MTQDGNNITKSDLLSKIIDFGSSLKKVELQVWLKIGIWLLASFVVGYIVYQNHEIKALNEKIVDIQLQNNNDLIEKLKNLSKTRRDSVFFYNNTVRYFERQIDEEQEQVSNTDNIDSLVILYKKHRASVSN